MTIYFPRVRGTGAGVWAGGTRKGIMGVNERKLSGSKMLGYKEAKQTILALFCGKLGFWSSFKIGKNSVYLVNTNLIKVNKFMLFCIKCLLR